MRVFHKLQMKNTDSAIFNGTELFNRIGAEERVGESLSPTTLDTYHRRLSAAAKRQSVEGLHALTAELLTKDYRERHATGAMSRGTARLDRAAFLYWIAAHAQGEWESGGENFDRLEAAYQELYSYDSHTLPSRTSATSSPKAKIFPDEAVRILESALSKWKSKPLQLAVLFVRANLIVGLRPVEWLDANFLSYLHTDPFGGYYTTPDGKLMSTPAMVVGNAKTSTLRGNGEARTILLPKDDPEALKRIAAWMQEIRRFGDAFDGAGDFSQRLEILFKSMRRALTRELKRGGWSGPMPTLYSTRHQAVANAKADERSGREIAALFGHSSVRTAWKYYGWKARGYQGRSLVPSQESVDAVRGGDMKPVHGAELGSVTDKSFNSPR